MKLSAASGGTSSGTRRSIELWRTKLCRSNSVFAFTSPDAVHLTINPCGMLQCILAKTNKHPGLKCAAARFPSRTGWIFFACKKMPFRLSTRPSDFDSLKNLIGQPL